MRSTIVRESKQYRVAGVCSYPLVIKDAEGCYLIDMNGDRYLDFNSNICTQNIGYGHPEIQEIIAAYSKKGIYKIAGSDFFSEEAWKLSKKVMEIAPTNMSKVFFVNSGAEAVENCLKLAFRKRGPHPGVSCKRAFHGRTLGALTHTESKRVQKENYPELPHHSIEFVTDDKDPEMDELEDLIKRDTPPAFVIVEPVQGEGGYRPASKKFMKMLRAVTKREGIPLICDEVQAGMGRTGKWWSHEHYGIQPDLMSSAKSLNVGAAFTTSEYDTEDCGSISSTWGGGHLIDLAVGAKVIEIIQRDKLLKNVEQMGRYFTKRLNEMKKKDSNIVDVRGFGLMIGVELQTEAQVKKLEAFCFKNKLSILPCGDQSIRIAPPFIIDEETADKGLDIIDRGLKKL